MFWVYRLIPVWRKNHKRSSSTRCNTNRTPRSQIYLPLRDFNLQLIPISHLNKQKVGLGSFYERQTRVLISCPQERGRELTLSSITWFVFVQVCTNNAENHASNTQEYILKSIPKTMCTLQWCTPSPFSPLHTFRCTRTHIINYYALSRHVHKV